MSGSSSERQLVQNVPFVSIAVSYFGSAIHKRFETIQAQLSELSAVVQENLAGVRVVRAYGQEAHEIDRFQAANQEYVLRNRGLIRLQGLFYPSMTFFLGLGALLVLWMGGQEVIRGRITLGEFFAFNSYLAMLSWPMIAFGWVTNILQRGAASWGRMLEIMDAVPALDGHRAEIAGRAMLCRRAVVFPIEFKCGERQFRLADYNQAWDYALDLKNFHAASRSTRTSSGARTRTCGRDSGSDVRLVSARRRSSNGQTPCQTTLDTAHIGAPSEIPAA